MATAVPVQGELEGKKRESVQFMRNADCDGNASSKNNSIGIRSNEGTKQRAVSMWDLEFFQLRARSCEALPRTLRRPASIQSHIFAAARTMGSIPCSKEDNLPVNLPDIIITWEEGEGRSIVLRLHSFVFFILKKKQRGRERTSSPLSSSPRSSRYASSAVKLDISRDSHRHSWR